MQKAIWGIAAVAALSGCATVKTLQPTGGSRADGTVELSYAFGMLEVPQVQWAQGDADAATRCAAWGYSGAERFGGEKRHCQQSDLYGNCTSVMVTITYQCTGRPD